MLASNFNNTSPEDKLGEQNELHWWGIYYETLKLCIVIVSFDGYLGVGYKYQTPRV